MCHRPRRSPQTQDAARPAKLQMINDTYLEKKEVTIGISLEIKNYLNLK
jgi:hypothetical protein